MLQKSCQIPSQTTDKRLRVVAEAASQDISRCVTDWLKHSWCFAANWEGFPRDEESFWKFLTANVKDTKHYLAQVSQTLLRKSLEPAHMSLYIVTENSCSNLLIHQLQQKPLFFNTVWTLLDKLSCNFFKWSLDVGCLLFRSLSGWSHTASIMLRSGLWGGFIPP